MEIDKHSSHVGLGELLGDPGVLRDTRLATEAAIKMQVADLMTIEAVADTAVARDMYEQKYIHVQDEVLRYLESLEQARQLGVEGVQMPAIVPDEQFVTALIEAARGDYTTIARSQTQIEALALEDGVGVAHQAVSLDERLFIDPIERKEDMYGHESLHTAKQAIVSLSKLALRQLMMRPTDRPRLAA